MNIPLNAICYMLPDIKIIGKTMASDISYKSVMLFDDQETEPALDVVYLISADDVSRDLGPRYYGTSFALVGVGEEQCSDFSQKNNCICLCFPLDHTQARVHDELQRTILTLSDWAAELDQAVYSCEHVSELVKKAEGIINDPILAWSPSFQMMATANTSAIDPDDMPALMSSFLRDKGWSGEDVETMIRKHDYLTMPMRYLDVRLLTPPNMMNCYSCVRNFSLSGKIVMTSGAYYLDGNRPHDGQIELLRMLFSRVLRYFELHSSTYTGSKKIYESFILGLIEGKLTNETDILGKLSYLNFPYSGEFEVIVVGCNDNVQPMALGLVRNYCKSFFRHTKFIEYRKHLVGLNNRQRDSESDIAMRLKIFSESSNVNDFSLGISSSFSCLIDTEQAFNEAKIALLYGGRLHPQKQYYTYRDYCVYFMLNKLNYGPNNRSKCPDAAYIYRLRDMDRKRSGLNNEQLLTTYILSGNNTSFTAEAINLHRNSILYRIKQIESILNLDLSDPSVIFHLMLGIKAVELNDLLDKDVPKERIDENW